MLTAYNEGYLTQPQAVAYCRRLLRVDLHKHFESWNCDDFSLIESNLLDVDGGLHCDGVRHRFEDRAYHAFDNLVAMRPGPK